MAITRRRFLTSVAAGSALAAVSATELMTTAPAFAASPVGDVVGKITVGYQGWFACIGDGSPINAWWHWSSNWAQPPSPTNNGTLRAWPDMTDYPARYQTAYANLGNGAPATLFSHYDQSTVNAHFLSMQQNGCDTAALQRFNPNGSEGPIRDAVTTRVRAAAEANSRKYYIMYDVTGWTNMQSEIKTDWTTKMSANTASTAYARQNGKPVVCIWGFGFNDNNHPWDANTCLDVVNWFKGQGCYVIGGVPREWRTGTGGSRPGFSGVYHAFNMLSPWMVGAIGNMADSDSVYQNINVPDQADCNANGVDYQPCVLPGDLSGRQRVHGDFMWRQFYNMVRVGAQGIYISMFDEFNEGNQITKTAATQAAVPTNSGLLALDEDGTACSSDYYLRLTNDGGRMLKGQLALTATRPTQPTTGGGGGGPTNLALGKATSESSHNLGFVSGNTVDGNSGSYWESANNAFPQWVQVDLGAVATVSQVILNLPASWGARSQTLSITCSTNGSTFSSLVGSGPQNFDPATGNAVVLNVLATQARYVRVNVTANTGWPAAQLSELQVFGTTGGSTDTQPPSAPTNLTVTGHTASSVSLAWTASTDNIGVSGYQIRQAGNVVGTTSATSFTVGGLSPSTVYSFTVTAQDAAGNTSAPSTAVSATTDAAPNTNLARGKATSESSHTQNLSSGNAVDGDANTYWESANNAFPQWWQVDLGSVQTISRLVLKLPPASSWGARTQNLTIAGGTNGVTFATLTSGTYSFSPATGNTLTVTFTPTAVRYVRVTVTGNSGWPAGQLSEVEVYTT
jgi:chitodextrinase